MLSEEEKKDIEQAVNNILRGIDIESSALILDKSIMDNYIIAKGRVSVLRIATRQILNFIEEYKNKGYLDVVREKVKANEEISKLQKEIDRQKEKRENQKVELAILNEKQKEMNKLKNTVSSYYGMFKKQEKQIKELQKENEEKDKEIETLKRDFKIVDQECSRLERKEAKQDKIIDLMAEFLGEKDMGYYKKEEGGEFLGIMRRYSKEDWKQYFERKVKND